ncbi:MAG: hypothetical protein CVT92_16760 [Bacteroidetes bacterium HGW-Bacteroidetes-1]|jgi:hypothetical protein|nr:MAG: hypothetical protein CVT92_16760 [Bacteroidetes bacterium HGW-Bacteroidetes-1]
MVYYLSGNVKLWVRRGKIKRAAKPAHMLTHFAAHLILQKGRQSVCLSPFCQIVAGQSVFLG